MKKKKGKFFKRNRLTLFLIILAFGYYGFIMMKADQKLEEYQGVQQELRAEIGDLEHEIDKLVDEYAYSQTPEAVEKIAREKLKMVKPNEIIYLIKELEESEGN
ncbi:septum formation initiator family protein [Fusibacter bizertensis]|uniref:Septum formation initiator family protein n=1 Tax=Fusibacter bizertensis TaxID=1488331 RepID=A0ABT6NGV4_9FIRM|nr:septum formation initiator family protein [Fusibacter bizertensis]MDH8679644.1 septum formation initiator family protein [Fusibacter bizertensis]